MSSLELHSFVSQLNPFPSICLRKDCTKYYYHRDNRMFDGEELQESSCFRSSPLIQMREGRKRKVCINTCLCTFHSKTSDSPKKDKRKMLTTQTCNFQSLLGQCKELSRKMNPVWHKLLSLEMKSGKSIETLTSHRPRQLQLQQSLLRMQMEMK